MRNLSFSDENALSLPISPHPSPGMIYSLNGTGATYLVAVQAHPDGGNYALSIIPTGHGIADAAGNGLAGAVLTAPPPEGDRQ